MVSVLFISIISILLDTTAQYKHLHTPTFTVSINTHTHLPLTTHNFPQHLHSPTTLRSPAHALMGEQIRLRRLSGFSDVENSTMEYTETLEKGSQHEQELEEARRAWVGPHVTSATLQFLLDIPAYADQRPSSPYNLGKVAFKVALIDRDDGRRYFVGHLASFFPYKLYIPDGMTPSPDEFYHPSKFLVDLFRVTIHNRLDLGDFEGECWTLWMRTGEDHPGIRIYDDQSLREALLYLNEWYVKKQPWKHYIAGFLVQLDDSESKRRFKHPDYPVRQQCWDSNDQVPRAPDSDGYGPDSNQSSGPTEYTPSASPGGSEHGADEEAIVLTQSSESREGQQQTTLPDRLSLGFEPHSPPLSEPVEEPGVLESIDTDTKKGSDVMDGDLDSILPLAGSPTDSEWTMCCSFLGLDVEEHEDPIKKSINIPHTNIFVTPRQYRTAFWMLSCRGDRGLCGGVLADVPGTGKTHTCIALVLLRALVAYNMAEVKKEWDTRAYEESKGKDRKSREFKHKSRDTPAAERCPCGDEQGILCYANSLGATRNIGDTMARGVSLILAPSGVIEEWKKTFANSMMNRKFFEPCLIHTTPMRELACPPNFEKRFQVKAAPRSDGFPKGYKPKVMDMDYTYTIETEQAKQPERFIIITTHSVEKLKEQFQFPVMVTIGNKKERMSVYGLPVGCQLVDEFHKVRSMSTPVVELAQEHKRIQRFNTEFWSVSGTIMPKSSFTDLESTIAIVQRLPWTQPGHRYHGSRLECVKDLEAAYFEAVSADKGSEAAVEAFKERTRQFFDGWIIRHTMESRLFGQRITNITEMKAVKKTFTTPPEYLEHMQALANLVSAHIRTITQSGSYEQVVRSLRTYTELTPLQVASTFPGAASLILQGKIKVDSASLRGLIKKAKGDVANVPEFTDHLPAVTAGSAKLEALFDLFLKMEEDHQSRPKPTDGSPRNLRENRQMKKLVVITPTLGEAIFLYLGLEKRLASIKGAKVVLLHADLLASEKQRMTADFQALTPGSAKILVTPYEVGGTGLNLQTANYQVLTGPLRTKDYELQAFARTNREGNSLRLHHWLYLTDDNPADRLVVARQANRRVASDPFDMGATFEVEKDDREKEG